MLCLISRLVQKKKRIFFLPIRLKHQSANADSESTNKDVEIVANQKVPNSKCNEQQAQKVAWRIIKDWVEAQMAIVEAQMADVAEVFLPYAVTNTGYDELLFSVGGHPAFAVPMLAGTNYTDYYLQFNKTELLEVTKF